MPGSLDPGPRLPDISAEPKLKSRSKSSVLMPFFLHLRYVPLTWQIRSFLFVYILIGLPHGFLDLVIFVSNARHVWNMLLYSLTRNTIEKDVLAERNRRTDHARLHGGISSVWFCFRLDWISLSDCRLFCTRNHTLDTYLQNERSLNMTAHKLRPSEPNPAQRVEKQTEKMH